MSSTKPWIAVFDLSVTRNSPAGSCVLTEVLGVANEFDITVFSDAFDCDATKRLQWVRVPLPKKPGFLRYMMFHMLAPLALRWHIRQRGIAPVLIQATQAQFIGANVCYPHFCHRAYLNNQWQLQRSTGLRRLARWITHSYNAATEALAFKRAQMVIAPSQGLIKELVATYPFLYGKTRQIPNPVDVAAFRRPDDFDRKMMRTTIGLNDNDKVLCFAALGDFERKGLGIIVDALVQIPDADVKLMVVGGSHSEILAFKEQAIRAGVIDRLLFTGFQKDVRPFFWASDLFVFPSTYEIFSLVLIQAPAAGLPVLATRLHGFEEYAEDGRNCWIVERTVESVRNAILDAICDSSRLKGIGAAALQAVQRYNKENFVAEWRSCIRAMLPEKSKE
ncbi:glycosyltransferase family 4 protein [Geobacter sp.]|uniref:glycosyltransferase family 4 protein n=1 Tax=Geobacter sp. TaxID=46610 RepID=UPI0026066A11|nr:glycosyltransferase family 4 protein [Geobacter sp.]